jgi:hypothetical protein
MLFVEKFSKVLMSYNKLYKNGTWDSQASNGGGLALLCALERYNTAYYDYYANRLVVNAWLNMDRSDFITSNLLIDTDPVGNGCALIFLYYLKTQLHFPVLEIIQNGGTTLEKTYKNLTTLNGGYKALSDLINCFFPVIETQIMLLTENPFPLLDASLRSISITGGPTNYGSPVLIKSGIAFRKFPGCNLGKDYVYFISKINESFTCTPQSIGFGQPQYTWLIGNEEISDNKVVTVQTKPAMVYYDDPTAPQNIRYDENPDNVSLRCIVFNNILTIEVIDPPIGHIILPIELIASDKFCNRNGVTANSTSSISITISFERLTWEPDYTKDALDCSRAIRKHLYTLTPPYNWLQWAIAVYFWLRDPVPSLDLSTLLNLLEEQKFAEEKIKGRTPVEVSDMILQLFINRFST